MKKHFLTIALMGLLLPGCMAAKQETASFDALSERYASDAEALAVSAAREISDRHTSYVPISVDAAPGAFGAALERELRNNGMTLVDSGGGVRLSYKLNVTQQDGKPLGYAEISSSDGKLLCFTRNLGEMRYTAAPSSEASSSSLESRPLPDPTVSTAKTDSPIIGGGRPVESEKAESAVPSEPVAVAESPVKTVAVTKSGTAATVARRYGVPVKDFCRWNNVGAGATLITGYQVYLSEPPAGTIPVAAENPVPAGVAAGTPEASLPAPVPASTTLPAHTSAKLSLPSAAPQKTETISYTPPVSSAPVAAPVTPPAPPAPVAEGPRVSPVSSPVPTSTPSGDTASAVPASLPADAEIIPVSNPAGMGVRSWEIVKGEMLKAQLERWASDAGYTLIWSAHNDYEMQSAATFNGSFQAAVKAFFGALQSGGHALRVTIFEGNNVMEVSEH